MLANLPIMLFPYAHKFYPLCFNFCPLCPHYANRITGKENNYSNYLTFIILQHQGNFNVVLYRDWNCCQLK